jgi:hypothetical protein
MCVTAYQILNELDMAGLLNAPYSSLMFRDWILVADVEGTRRNANAVREKYSTLLFK